MRPRPLEKMRSLGADAFEHGTRGRYVMGCRCAMCRRATADYEAERTRKKRELAVELFGPRTSETHCVGVNGSPCPGGRKLRVDSTSKFCNRCVLKIGCNAPVDVTSVRAHLFRLRDAGIGRRSVAAACDVTQTVIADIMSGAKTTIRPDTAKKILEVDASAVADRGFVDAAETWQLLGELMSLGLQKYELARLLGSTAKVPALQLRPDRVYASTAQRVRKLHAKIVADFARRAELRAELAGAADKGSEWFDRESYSVIVRTQNGRGRPKSVCGTNSRYVGGCRCDACRNAHREYSNALYARKRAELAGAAA